MHYLNEHEIRQFIDDLRKLDTYGLDEERRKNINDQRYACLPLIEAEEHRRGLSAGA